MGERRSTGRGGRRVTPVFRNSAFAAATLRVGSVLSAPPYIDVLLATGTALFALANTLAYDAWRNPGPARGAVESLRIATRDAPVRRVRPRLRR